MPGSEPTQEFLVRLNAGKESAAADLYEKYFERLCQRAAGLIGERLKRQYGAEDAAQSALASFFGGIPKKKYHFEHSGRLWSLLVTILRHKIQERGRKAREDILAIDVADGNPSRDKAVELADAIEAATMGFKPLHLEICRLFYQEGLSPPPPRNWCPGGPCTVDGPTCFE